MASEPPAVSRDRREQLRHFLRTRRARLTPADVGLPTVGTRRTPGLRREEVAALAGVGVSWYTWLEQGRDITASAEVIDAIARALRLTDAERVHLHLLAGLHPPPVHAAPSVTPELRQLVEAWAPRPAMLQDRYWNLLVVNQPARAALGLDEADRNCLVTFFLSPRYRRMQAEWEVVAPGIVAAFRADAARFPGDPGFARVVDELSAASPEFAALWARHDVGVHVQAVKAANHPEVGELLFDATTLAVPDGSDLRLVLYDPRPGTATAERLERLATIRLAAPA